ncbi:MAG: SIS domain-containing protein [Campylobacterales bacterium]
MELLDVAKNVIQTEIDELYSLKNRLNSSFIEAVETIHKTSGKLIIIGVGKSGLVGSKMAATLASTGTSSFFIHPTEAMHGDLGMISTQDSVVAISYSGESEEIVKAVPHIKEMGVKLIGMSGNPSSTLAKYSDIHLDIGVNKEACPLNIAPTSSTTITMALGDALAVVLMKKRGFKQSDFAKLHPGGSLGKKLYMKASNLLRTDFPTVSHETSLKDAVVKMSEGRLGNILIVDSDKKLIALLSDGDLRRAMMSEGFDINATALNYATKNPKRLNDSSILASEALRFVEDNKIQLLIFTDSDNKVEGVIHIHDLIEAGIK